MKRILCSDWFPEQLSNACLALFGLPALSRQKSYLGGIPNHFLNKLVRLRWLGISLVIYLRFLLTSTSSRSVKTQTDLVSDAYLICSTTDNSPTIYSYTIK